jgi:hypothetical protein
MGIKRIEDMTSEDDRIFRQQVNKNTIAEYTLQSRGNHTQPDSPVERDCRNCFNYAHCWDFVHAPKVCPLAQPDASSKDGHGASMEHNAPEGGLK